MLFFRQQVQPFLGVSIKSERSLASYSLCRVVSDGPCFISYSFRSDILAFSVLVLISVYSLCNFILIEPCSKIEADDRDGPSLILYWAYVKLVLSVTLSTILYFFMNGLELDIVSLYLFNPLFTPMLQWRSDPVFTE